MSTPSSPLKNLRCPLCGGDNHCAPAQAGHFDVACWCRDATISREALARIPADQVRRACICPRCATGQDLPDTEPAPR